MSRTRLLAIVVAVIAIAAGVFFWWPRSEPTATPSQPKAASGPDRGAIVRDKLAARHRGDVDVSPATVSGRVSRKNDGRGVAGALVLLTPKGFGDAQGQTPGKPALPQYATADATGNWTIKAVRPGRYTLGASATGFLPARIGVVDVAAGRDNPGFDVALEAGGHPLTGVVSDTTGGPIEGALVSVLRMDEGNLLSFDRAPAGALTDEEGRFAFQVSPGQYTVSAEHVDYVSDNTMTEVADGPRSVKLALTPGSTISGIVRAHPGGEPVVGAVVVAGDADNGGGGFSIGGFGNHRVVTDEAGRFSLHGLSSGVHGLTAVAPKHATAEPLEVALGVAEEVENVELWVEAAFTISGFVVRRGHEQEGGIEGVLVGAFSLQPPALFAGARPSGEDGYFEIFGVPKGNYMIAAIGDEALPNFTGTGAQVADADVTDVLVVMDPGVTLRGRVSPAVAATITITLDGESLGFSNMLGSIGNAFVRARTEADGSFELSPVASGKVSLRATADDGSKGELAVEVGDVDRDGLVIEMMPRASLAGRVIDANGQPVAGVTVAATSKDGKREGGFSMGFNGPNMGDTQATTTEDGAFVVRGLETGAYLVSVRAKGPALAWAKPVDPKEPTAPLEIDVAIDRAGAPLELVVEARDGVIRGVVVDGEGGPVADAWVTAYREGSGEAAFAERTATRTTGQRRAEVPKDASPPSAAFGDESFFGEKHEPVLTEADGKFTIEGLRAGTYGVVVEADKGSAKARHKGVALGSKLRIEVATLGTIAGVVERAGKKVDATVEVKGPTDRSKRARAGEFQLDRLEAGKYEVFARTEDASARVEVEVKTGERVEVKLALEGFGKLRGKLVDPTGSPIAGMSVMVQPEKGSVNAKQVFSMMTGVGTKTDSEGRFEVDQVPPGKGGVELLDGDALAGGSVAHVKYEMPTEGDEDLGTITGVRSSKVPPDERGELGLSSHTATFAKRPRVGDGEEKDDDAAAADETERLWVISVDVDGPADTAGVEPGDEITAIDGQGVAGLGARAASVLLAPHNLRAGQDVRLELTRDGSGRSITVRARPKATKDGPPKPE